MSDNNRIPEAELKVILRNHAIWVGTRNNKRRGGKCADLSDKDLSYSAGEMFCRRDLSKIICRNTDFSGVDLENTKFIGAHLEGASFNVNTDLSGTDFKGTFMDKATDFTGADLRKIKFFVEDFIHVNLLVVDRDKLPKKLQLLRDEQETTQQHKQSAESPPFKWTDNFRNTKPPKISSVNPPKAGTPQHPKIPKGKGEITYHDLHKLLIAHRQWRHDKVGEPSDFSGWTMPYKHPELAGSNLGGAICRNTDFSVTDLSYVSFGDKAELRGARFSGKTKFDDTDFRGALMDATTDFTGADLRKIKDDKKTVEAFQDVNLLVVHPGKLPSNLQVLRFKQKQQHDREPKAWAAKFKGGEARWGIGF